MTHLLGLTVTSDEMESLGDLAGCRVQRVCICGSCLFPRTAWIRLLVDQPSPVLWLGCDSHSAKTEVYRQDSQAVTVEFVAPNRTGRGRLKSPQGYQPMPTEEAQSGEPGNGQAMDCIERMNR